MTQPSTAAHTRTTCLDSIPGCPVEGFHDHPESLPPDVIAMSEEGFGERCLPARSHTTQQPERKTMNRWLLHKDIGRLRGLFNPRYLRHVEIRWVGRHVQWVLSPVQVAVWTQMHTVQPNSRFNWCPLSRAWVG